MKNPKMKLINSVPKIQENKVLGNLNKRSARRTPETIKYY